MSGASGGGAGRVVAAARVHLDVAEAALGEVRLAARPPRRRSVMSGTRRRSSLATARCGSTVLPPGPGVAADQALDVDGGREDSRSSDCAPGRVVRPALGREQPLGGGLVEARRGRRRACAFSAAVGGRAASAKPSMAGSPSAVTSVASACTRWKAGLSSRARLLECTSLPGPRPHFSPLATSSSSTTPLAPRDTVTLPSGSCAAQGMKTPLQRESAALTSGRRTICAEVRRADLLLALGHQHEVHGQLAARAADRVQRGQERRLGALLVDGAAADQHLAEAGLVDERRRRRAATTTRRGPPASRRT